ncbi:MAG: peptidoglycan DD-metalloendopeptidase family protein [Pseudomonadota bacterium]
MTDASFGRDTIVVERGDTLYGLARRHRVSVSALKDANGLTGNVIRPGQTLALPGSNAATGSARPVLPPQTPNYTSAPARDGTYVVQPGDSLYRIARQTGVSVADLQSYNSVADVRRLMPGMVLRLAPNDGGTQTVRSVPVRETSRPVTPRSAGGARIINRPSDSGRTLTDLPPTTPRPGQKSARLADPVTQPRSTSKFDWPARGRIISRFGPRRDGSHNDGIDIAVPAGTEIRAAADGVVAYADSELKAYGNLVLLRHDNGWVSAYAHASSLLVKRGDDVRRGQVIARVGQTGSVTKPTLHFELRDGAKPVNPLPHLPR